eukprot:gene1828-3540_t
MQLKLEDFKVKVKNELGFVLTEKETSKIFLKYGDKDSQSIDYQRFLTDFIKGLRTTEETIHRHEPVLNNFRYLSHDAVMQEIRDRITCRTTSNSKTDNRSQKAFFLLSEPRCHEITRAQLKRNLECRLLISLTDSQIEEIFDRYDTMREGVVKTRNFVNGLFKDSVDPVGMSLTIDSGIGNIGVKSTATSKPPSVARVSYDKTFSGLSEPPAPEHMRPQTVLELERRIREQILNRCKGANKYVLTFLRCFGDTTDKNAKEIKTISRDQMRYTLWGRFQLSVSDAEIDLLFLKYDKNNTGVIKAYDFLRGIIKEHAMNEPLLTDPGNDVVSKSNESSDVSALFFMRRKLLDRLNREGKSPIDIINSAGKMNQEDFIKFMCSRFKTKPSAVFIEEVEADYSDGHLIDVRRLLHDAMCVSDGSSRLALNKSLFGNTRSYVTQIPECVRGQRSTPAQIEEKFRWKILERAKRRTPIMSQLHVLFRQDEKGYGDVMHVPNIANSVISKDSMKKALASFDIIAREDDFDEFFSGHDRGDGYANFREFVQRIFPSENHEENPFFPKNTKDFKNHVKFSRQLSAMTGEKRDVPSLTGISGLRMEINDMTTSQDMSAINVSMDQNHGGHQTRVHLDTHNSDIGSSGHRLGLRESTPPPSTSTGVQRTPRQPPNEHPVSSPSAERGGRSYSVGKPLGESKHTPSSLDRTQDNHNPVFTDDDSIYGLRFEDDSDISSIAGSQRAPPPTSPRTRISNYHTSNTLGEGRHAVPAPPSAVSAQNISEELFGIKSIPEVLDNNNSYSNQLSDHRIDVVQLSPRKVAFSGGRPSSAPMERKRLLLSQFGTPRSPVRPADDIKSDKPPTSPRPEFIARTPLHHSSPRPSSANTAAVRRRDHNTPTNQQRPSEDVYVTLRLTDRDEDGNWRISDSVMHEQPGGNIGAPKRPMSAYSSRSMSAKTYKGRINQIKTGKRMTNFETVTSRDQVNPYTSLMRKRFVISSKLTKTAHEEYGLFIKNIKNAASPRAK